MVGLGVVYVHNILVKVCQGEMDLHTFERLGTSNGRENLHANILGPLREWIALGHFLNADGWIDLEVMVIFFPKSVGPVR